MGNVVQAGVGPNPARLAAFHGGIPMRVATEKYQAGLGISRQDQGSLAAERTPGTRR
jgi:hypothetical protein